MPNPMEQTLLNLIAGADERPALLAPGRPSLTYRQLRANVAELAAQLGELAPHEVPLNFLNPRPGTPFGDLPVMDSRDALRTIAAFRLALPRTILRYAGGRELTLGDLGTRDGLLGGINAVIVGNYLTTLGRDADEDLALLSDLKMPIKELAKTL